MQEESKSFEKATGEESEPLVLDEFFSGCGIMSQTFREGGWKTREYDIEAWNEHTIVQDVLEVDRSDADAMWFSPPCTGFSVASMTHHWEKPNKLDLHREPKSETSKLGLELLDHTIRIIANTIKTQGREIPWYIENPRGMMRIVINKVFEKYGIKNYRRHTVSYCQYGDDRMKPTDIWTNNKAWNPFLACSPNDPCHEPSPRGSSGGTQGLSNAHERGKIPAELCQEILKVTNKPRFKDPWEE